MFELIIYITMLGGDTEVAYSSEYQYSQACAFNLGTWTQYLSEQEHLQAEVSKYDYADLNDDGIYDYMNITIDIEDEDEEGYYSLICVRSNDERKDGKENT